MGEDLSILFVCERNVVQGPMVNNLKFYFIDFLFLFLDGGSF